MDINKMLSELRSERDRIEAAISAVEALAGRDSYASPAATRTTSSGPGIKGKRRNLTAAGRKRLSENMKRRWAERKKAAAKAARAA